MGDAVRRFEDLLAWQKARALTAGVYDVTADGSFSRDFDLRNQIREAAVSTMSNIAEGFDRASHNEFHRFLSIAKGSCGELRSQLYVALDAGYIDRETFGRLQEQALEASRIINGLRAHQ